MHSGESVICYGFFKGRTIVHLVRKNIVEGSIIRDVFLDSCNVLYIFARVGVLGMHVH